MSRMSDYCKAYHVKRFREYPHWSEREVAGLHAELLDEVNDADSSSSGGDGGGDGSRDPSVARPLSDDDVLFLHDNYHVTDGVFADEHVVFDDVTPEWRMFCHSVLGFEVPDYARPTPADQKANDGESHEAGDAIAPNTTTMAAGV